jgi:hypothetical protein
LYIFFSLFLLFGSSIQDLWMGADGDIVFEVIRNIMLAYFVWDMLIRCLTDKEYFVCTVGGGSASAMTPTASGTPLAGSNNAASGGPTRHSMTHFDAKEMHPQFATGSFFFWCDLVSTLAILYDLSYVNKNSNGVQQVQIGLDNDGVPVSEDAGMMCISFHC